jgi:hypothetical protein
MLTRGARVGACFGTLLDQGHRRVKRSEPERAEQSLLRARSGVTRPGADGRSGPHRGPQQARPRTWPPAERRGRENNRSQGRQKHLSRLCRAGPAETAA